MWGSCRKYVLRIFFSSPHWKRCYSILRDKDWFLTAFVSMVTRYFWMRQQGGSSGRSMTALSFQASQRRVCHRDLNECWERHRALMRCIVAYVLFGGKKA